jgi:hypothetical protein
MMRPPTNAVNRKPGERPLSLPEIKSEHIDGANHRGAHHRRATVAVVGHIADGSAEIGR